MVGELLLASQQVIEDLLPLFNVPVTLRLPQTIKRAWLVPQGESLTLDVVGEAVLVTVPKVECYQAIVLEIE